MASWWAWFFPSATATASGVESASQVQSVTFTGGANGQPSGVEITSTPESLSFVATANTSPIGEEGTLSVEPVGFSAAASVSVNGHQDSSQIQNVNFAAAANQTLSGEESISETGVVIAITATSVNIVISGVELAIDSATPFVSADAASQIIGHELAASAAAISVIATGGVQLVGVQAEAQGQQIVAEAEAQEEQITVSGISYPQVNLNAKPKLSGISALTSISNVTASGTVIINAEANVIYLQINATISGIQTRTISNPTPEEFLLLLVA